MQSTCYAFDLDGTLTRQEILPLIASSLGLEKEMRLLTELTINGVIPFEDSFRLRCSCLRSASVRDIQSIVSNVEFDPYLEDFVRNNQNKCTVITGNLDVWIQPLIERLGCNFYSSTGVVINDRLQEIGTVLKKNNPVLELRTKFRKIIAVGDGVNDMPMFDAADIRIAYGGVHKPAKQLIEMSDYVTFRGDALCRLLNTL